MRVKKGQTKAELHRGCGGSAVGILPMEITHPAVGARFAPASEVLLLLPSCARNEALD